MHDNGIHQATALQRRLEEQGINLSSSQVHRLVTETPERLNLTVLAALCTILDCSPSDLIDVHAVREQREAANGGTVVDLATTIRPKRARITRPTD
jgi:DNA-binding Xre family transcriptional regulator